MLNSTEKTQNMSPRREAQIMYAKMGHVTIFSINDFTFIHIGYTHKWRLITIFFLGVKLLREPVRPSLTQVVTQSVTHKCNSQYV